MQWKQLLSIKRSGNEEEIRARADLRSEFEKDYHKIISSASFRRLQDKTQVFPLDKSDFIRTRLTHSLEVSSVGRSLAQNISERIIDMRIDPDFTLETERAITEVIECAGLIHSRYRESSVRSFRGGGYTRVVRETFAAPSDGREAGDRYSYRAGTERFSSF